MNRVKLLELIQLFGQTSAHFGRKSCIIHSRGEHGLQAIRNECDKIFAEIQTLIGDDHEQTTSNRLDQSPDAGN